MQCGIIGLPQAGKTTLFRMLTGLPARESHSYSGPQHVGIVHVRDERLDRLSKLFSPLKTTYATMECADVAAIGKDTLKESAYLGNLRNMDALAHVVRIFPDESVPHIQGNIDPQRDISSVELDLILADLGVVENRLNKLAKERKKIKNAAMEKEMALLERARQWLETEKPLREVEWSEEEKKQLRGFLFLSEKPMLLVINAGEEAVGKMDEVLHSIGLDQPDRHPNSRAMVVSAKVEAELAEMPDLEAADFRNSYGLRESGLERLMRTIYALLGRIAFFTVGEKECRAWSITRGISAQQAAGVIHTDMAKRFIRAEVIAWDKLVEYGGFTEARQAGLVRLEGKNYIVQDGEIVHIRHSG